MTIAAGKYKAKRNMDREIQFGKTSGGHEQIAVDLKLADGHDVTTFLIFSDASRPYSEDRLKALGWKGQGNDLGALDAEVDVEISYQEYKGEQKMRVEILTNGGRVKLKETMDEAQKKNFLSRLTGTPATGKAPF